MTIYQGVHPCVPVLACYRHLGFEWDVKALKTIRDWNWDENPLLFIGNDKDGYAVGCLVHGRYGQYYQRALNGITSIFGLAVNLVDIEYMLYRQATSKYEYFSKLFLACWFPGGFLQYLNRPISNIVDTYLLLQQEGQR